MHALNKRENHGHGNDLSLTTNIKRPKQLFLPVVKEGGGSLVS